MAQPISLSQDQVPRRDPRVVLQSRLQDAPAEHAEALLAGYEVLQGFHDSGVLDLLRGVRRMRACRRLSDASESGISLSWLRPIEVSQYSWNRWFCAIPESPTSAPGARPLRVRHHWT